MPDRPKDNSLGIGFSDANETDCQDALNVGQSQSLDLAPFSKCGPAEDVTVEVPVRREGFGSSVFASSSDRRDDFDRHIGIDDLTDGAEVIPHFGQNHRESLRLLFRHAQKRAQFGRHASIQTS